MRLGNTVDFPLAYLGALAAGLVPVPTAAALTEPEVAAIIATLAPKAVLRDPAVPCPPNDTTVDLAQLRSMRDLPAAPGIWETPTGWAISSIPLARRAGRAR